MPLWSGVLIFKNGPIGGYINHITDNSVEIHFKHTRNTLLGKISSFYSRQILTNFKFILRSKKKGQNEKKNNAE